MPARPIDPETLPPVIPLRVCSQVLGIGENKQYELVRDGRYPVRILTIGGRFRVSRYDLLDYLHAPQQAEPARAAS